MASSEQENDRKFGLFSDAAQCSLSREGQLSWRVHEREGLLSVGWMCLPSGGKGPDSEMDLIVTLIGVFYGLPREAFSLFVASVKDAFLAAFNLCCEGAGGPYQVLGQGGVWWGLAVCLPTSEQLVVTLNSEQLKGALRAAAACEIPAVASASWAWNCKELHSVSSDGRSHPWLPGLYS